MSAHSAHKWQTLGTRESVKETRSNMQQYNKNGKSKFTFQLYVSMRMLSVQIIDTLSCLSIYSWQIFMGRLRNDAPVVVIKRY